MKPDGVLAKITAQVIVNVATAVLLFLLAMAFQAEVQDLFDSLFGREAEPFPSYPIHCAAEPHAGDPEGKELTVDFFIINATGLRYTTPELRDRLRAANPDDSRTLRPRIVLELAGHATARFLEKESRAFNTGKGDIRVTIDPDASTLAIDILRIEARAILKAAFRIGDLHDVPEDLSRGMVSATQIENQDVLGKCFSR